MASCSFRTSRILRVVYQLQLRKEIRLIHSMSSRYSATDYYRTQTSQRDSFHCNVGNASTSTDWWDITRINRVSCSSSSVLIENIMFKSRRYTCTFELKYGLFTALHITLQRSFSETSDFCNLNWTCFLWSSVHCKFHPTLYVPMLIYACYFSEWLMILYAYHD